LPSALRKWLVHPAVIEHRLNVDPNDKPMIKKKRYMGPKQATAGTADVQKLLEAGFIRECYYPE